MQAVFKFNPIYKERIWGNCAIASLGNRHLPKGKKIGESWEISDREGDESMIGEGEWSGKSIRWLLNKHGAFVMGVPWPMGKRFPLLIKILDATERLSLQIHPPKNLAALLGGEPKTEMWYLLDSKPRATLLVGLKKGVTREQFEKQLHFVNQGTEGGLEPLIHRIHVQKGDAMFIPSGRIHAIDAGCLIFEIQQNSDTTYRVYDWGRVGEDGKPRQLHVEKTLQCMDFNDFEPKLVEGLEKNGVQDLVNCDYFQVESWHIHGEKEMKLKAATVLHTIAGGLKIVSDDGTCCLKQGETALLAAVPLKVLSLDKSTDFLMTQCK